MKQNLNCKIYHIGGADSTVATIGLSDESQVIAHVPYETPDDRANAEFIVRAVNSHDALVSALQKIHDGLFATKKLEGHLSDTLRESLTHHIATARAAIALAMGNELQAPAVSANLNQPL